jgi:hypothetical protein
VTKLVALVTALSLLPCTAATAAADIELEPGCENRQLAQFLAPYDTIEMGAAAGRRIPRDRAAVYRKMEEGVAACARRGTRITVRPITERAMGELPVFADIVPDRTGENRYNEQHYMFDRTNYNQRVAAALDGLPAIGADRKGSDPLGTLTSAARALPANSKAIIILICHGWQQTRELNVFAYRTDPASYAPVALSMLEKHHSLPDLSGVHVVIAGRTTGDSAIQLTDAQLAGLCDFWKTIVVHAHGTMDQADCGVTLPGITR